MHESTRLLRDLVAIPSVNPMGRDLQSPDLYEHRVTAYLEDFFRSLGVPYERQAVAAQRENIVARYEPAGATSTLILEAHQDTVPTDNMIIKPFDPRIENGKLYGRGSCDIKGGMAAMLATFARVVREKPAGACRVVMACSVDEEHTMLGVKGLAQLNFGPKPVQAVVAEPTNLNIVNAHKGACRWHIFTKGRSCHSSRPELGINAIYHMAQIVLAVQQFADNLRATKIDPILGPATMNIGRIEGGTSVNTVPDRCKVEIDRRVLPGEDPRKLPGDLIAFVKSKVGREVEFEFTEPWIMMPALSAAASGDLVEQLGQAIDKVKGKHEVMSVPYGTDAATLAEAGIPSVVFGPGDISRAHTCDEWTPLDEVEQASEILFKLATAK